MEKIFAIMNGINEIAAEVYRANIRTPDGPGAVNRSVLLVHPKIFDMQVTASQRMLPAGAEVNNEYVATTHGIPVYPSFGVPENEVHVFSPAYAGKVTLQIKDNDKRS